MNDLSKVVDKLLAQGLLALRGTCVMPRLVNSDYSNLAAQQGASIDVPIPSAIKAQAVTPGATSQDTGDISPVSATIKLDRWMEAPFYLTDKDLMEANRGVIPMQASEAVKAIANDVNATLLGLGRKFYGMVGTPGTTPFSTVVDATNARKVLNRQLAPVNDRRIVLDPDAEAAALGLSGFADVSKSGDARPIIDGTIGRKYGFDWAMDQQVPTFEASVMTEGALTVNGANEAGAQVVSLAKATNAAAATPPPMTSTRLVDSKDLENSGLSRRSFSTAMRTSSAALLVLASLSLPIHDTCSRILAISNMYLLSPGEGRIGTRMRLAAAQQAVGDQTHGRVLHAFHYILFTHAVPKQAHGKVFLDQQIQHRVLGRLAEGLAKGHGAFAFAPEVLFAGDRGDVDVLPAHDLREIFPAFGGEHVLFDLFAFLRQGFEQAVRPPRKESGYTVKTCH